MRYKSEAHVAQNAKQNNKASDNCHVRADASLKAVRKVVARDERSFARRKAIAHVNDAIASDIMFTSAAFFPAIVGKPIPRTATSAGADTAATAAAVVDDDNDDSSK